MADRFYSGLLPISDAERAQWAADRRESLDRGVVRRRVCASGQNYDVPGTPESKRRDDAILGEARNSPQNALSCEEPPIVAE
jgi:hypothetical protein